jgi:hypothetical protein
MAFVDPFLLVVTLVMTCLLIVGNLYFVAKFAHPADSAFGSSTAIKGIIVSLRHVLEGRIVNKNEFR